MKLFALSQPNLIKNYLHGKSFNTTGERGLEEEQGCNCQVKVINRVKNKNHKDICLVIATEAQRIL